MNKICTQQSTHFLFLSKHYFNKISSFYRQELSKEESNLMNSRLFNFAELTGDNFCSQLIVKNSNIFSGSEIRDDFKKIKKEIIFSIFHKNKVR